MAKKLNNQSAVIVEPNIFAATNPGYGVMGSSPAPAPTPAAVPALDPSSYTFTAEQLGLDTEPAKPAPAGNAREFAGTLIDNGTQPVNGGKLGDFFRGLSGKVRDWRGSDASKGDGGTIGYLGSLYTSPAEEAEYRRRSQNKMKLMALADAVRQFGNIYHTTRSAPSQQFDNIYDKERARYLQDKAVRDRDNQYYFQQKAREAQMDMQRERMEAEAARRAEELAMKKEINELRKPYYENQAKEARYRAEMKEKEAAHYDTALQKKDEYEDARIDRQKAGAEQSRASAHRAYVAANNDTRKTNSTIAKNARTGGGGSRGGGGKNYTYATDQGYIERAKDFNATELGQWENWLRETGQFTKEYEAGLRNASSAKERERLIRYAIGYSLEHNPKATAYATEQHNARSIKTTARNTRGTTARHQTSSGKGGGSGKKTARQTSVTYEKDKNGKTIIPW